MRRILLLAALAGLSSTAAQLLLFGHHAGDLTIPLWGARELLAGHNPYAADYSRLAPGHPEFWPLYYPLPALLLLMVLTPLPDPLAAGVFSALSTAALLYATRERPYMAVLFLGYPGVMALAYAQWSPLMTAMALLCPALCWCKPNVGLPLLLAELPRSRRMWLAIGLVGALTALSIPLGWGRAVAQHQNFVPLLAPLGMCILVCLFRWRDTDARRILLLACAPQRWYVDQVPLGLTTRGWRSGVLLAVLSWGVPVLTAWRPSDMWVVLCLYLPAVILALWPARRLVHPHVADVAGAAVGRRRGVQIGGRAAGRAGRDIGP